MKWCEACDPVREVDRIAALPVFERAPDADIRQRYPLLWDHQLEALAKARACGGLIADLPVGSGKTLITYLLPTVCKLWRPMLIIPASLRRKTYDDFRKLGDQGYPVPVGLRVISYTELSIDRNNRIFEDFRPDGIIADEAHKLSSFDAGCTRKVRRYLGEHQDTKFYALSGTILGTKLTELGHLCEWALRHGSPLPRSRSVLQGWSDAIDLDPMQLVQLRRRRMSFPVDPARAARYRLERLGKGDPRAAVGHRIRSAPGVVSLDESDVRTKLRIETVPLASSTSRALTRLREEWELPSGELVEEPSARWRHATTLSYGFYHHWDPEPPAAWLAVRKEWVRRIKDVIDAGTYDTPRAAEKAIQDTAIAERWGAIRATYKPVSKVVWADLDAPALRQAAQWAKDHVGLVWVRHHALGARVAELAGVDHLYDGRPPVEGQSHVLSIASYGAGHNLQAWNRSLVLEASSDATVWQQLIGRTYRTGQQNDVMISIAIVCKEMQNSLEDARNRSRVVAVLRRCQPLLLR